LQPATVSTSTHAFAPVIVDVVTSRHLSSGHSPPQLPAAKTTSTLSIVHIAETLRANRKMAQQALAEIELGQADPPRHRTAGREHVECVVEREELNPAMKPIAKRGAHFAPEPLREHGGEKLVRHIVRQQPVTACRRSSSHDASSTPSPTNERNKRSYSSRSMIWRSERMP
jgi:hypothetical protein